MKCVREFGVIDEGYDEQLITEVIGIVQADSRSFDKSLLYSSVEDKKFIDENKRTSIFKIFKDKQLFDLIDDVIDKINEKDEFYHFMLVKNDVTFIKYSKGGFFEEHEDYLSINSNILEEFTMIICVDANCKGFGGETVIKINDNFQHKSISAITPKHSLLFRKDLKHKSVEITKDDGYKHIITINLWAFNKMDHYNQEIIIISFPNESEKNNKSQLPVIISAKNVTILKKTKLAQYFWFRAPKIMYHYTEKELSPEIYENVFYKIYNRMYVNICDFHKYKQQILEFGFEEKDVLIDYSPKTSLEHKHNTAPNMIVDEMKDNGHSIYLCDNLEQQIFILNEIKSEKLPYIPFKIVFVEGTYGYNFDEYENFEELLEKSGGNEFKMEPIWLSFGEENLISYYSVYDHVENGKPKFDLTKTAKPNMSNKDILKKVFSRNGFDEMDYEAHWEQRSLDVENIEMYQMEIDGFQLIPLQNQQHIENLYEIIGNLKCQQEDWRDSYPVYRNFIFNEKSKIQMARFAPVTINDLSHFNGFNQPKLKRHGTQYIDAINEYLRKNELKSPFEDVPIDKRINTFTKSRNVYFINDEDGMMILNKRYYDNVLKMANENKLEQHVKVHINSMNYNFPQLKESVTIDFCNESFYGKLNIIVSTGFIKVERRKDDAFVVEKLPIILKELFPMEICQIVILYVAIEP